MNNDWNFEGFFSCLYDAFALYASQGLYFDDLHIDRILVATNSQDHKLIPLIISPLVTKK